MKYKLLALDMDGTTLNSEKKISAATANAISKLVKKNIHVVLSTGRGLAELADYSKEIKPINYGILISGGMIYDFFEKKPIISHALQEKILFELIDGAVAENAMIQLLTVNDSITREKDILNMKDFGMEIYQDMYFRNCVRCDDFKKFIRENPEKILKLNIYHRSKESREKNLKRFENLDVTFSYAEETALEVSPKNITKASGLYELCKFLKIDVSETVVVGDAPNDLEILRAAGVAAVMGKASDEIKKVADFVTADNDHDGVVKVIQKYF